MCLVCIIVRLFCSRVCRERALLAEHAIRTPSGNLFVLVKCWTGTCAWFLWGQNSSSEFSSEHRGWHQKKMAFFVYPVFITILQLLRLKGDLWLHTQIFMYLSPPPHLWCCEGVCLQKSAVLSPLYGVGPGRPLGLPGRELRMPSELYFLHLCGAAILQGLGN